MYNVFMKPPSRRRVGLLAVGLLLLAQLACSLANPTPYVWVLTPTALAKAATSTALAQTRAAGNLPLPTFTPTPSVVPLTPTPTETNLIPLGPWLVYLSDNGKSLVAINPDGSGMTRLPLPSLLQASDLVDGINPKGGMLALRTGNPSDFSGLELILVHLPSGQIEKISPLLSSTLQTLVTGGLGGDRPLLAARAVSERGAIRWSPSGRYLAFIGAIDGDSSDLYIYDTREHLITRLTSGSNQAATPFWSLDNQWLITQEFSGYAPTRGWLLTTVWAASANSLQMVRLYDPPADSTAEVFVGWLGSEQLLCYSSSLQGSITLRRVDIARSVAVTILPGPFSELAFEPESRTVALVSTGGARTVLPSGLYLLPDNTQDPILVETGNWHGLSWSPQNHLFVASGPMGVLRLGLNGSQSVLRNEASASLSPSGSWLTAWGSAPDDPRPGVRLYKPTGELLQTITSDSVQDLAWQPNSNGFFYLAGTRLFRVDFPRLQPVLVDENIQPGQKSGLTWISGYLR
jgi:hypothetical protein